MSGSQLLQFKGPVGVGKRETLPFLTPNTASLLLETVHSKVRELLFIFSGKEKRFRIVSLLYFYL